MKILVAGCNGLLGQNLLRTGAQAGGFELAGLGFEPEPVMPKWLDYYQSVDIGDRLALQAAVEKARPDFIINAAAITNVDACERDPQLCDRINRDAVGWMAETGAPMAQVSTDYVFDGEQGPYMEDAPVHPLSHYGRAKFESEALALGKSPRSLVVRTLLLWGLGSGAKKSFTAFVRESLEAKKSIPVVTDQWGNPTLAHDLALAILFLIRGGRSGIYHAAGADWMSRFDWALAVAAFYGLDPAGIRPALTSDLKQDAIRPLRSGLSCDKLRRDTGFTLRGLRAQLEWMHDRESPGKTP